MLDHLPGVGVEKVGQLPEVSAVEHGSGPSSPVVDDGPHGRDDVLAGLAEARAPVAYTGAIGGDPAFADLIIAAAAGARPLTRTS